MIKPTQNSFLLNYYDRIQERDIVNLIEVDTENNKTLALIKVLKAKKTKLTRKFHNNSYYKAFYSYDYWLAWKNTNDTKVAYTLLLETKTKDSNKQFKKAFKLFIEAVNASKSLEFITHYENKYML